MVPNGTVVRIRGQRNSAKAPRQQGVGFPAEGADRHSGGLDVSSVARSSIAVVEAGRPATFFPMGLVVLRAWSYLRFVIQQANLKEKASQMWGARAKR